MKRHLVCGVAAAVFGTFGTAASAAPQADSAKLRPALTVEGWKPPLGADGSPTNPTAPEGQNGGEADPASVHERAQGAGDQGAAGNGDGTRRMRFPAELTPY